MTHVRLSAALFCAAALTSGSADAALHVPGGFQLTRIASVPGAREIAAASNGDLLVGTNSGDVYIVPNADGSARTPRVFVHIADSPAAGVTIANGTLFIGSQFGVWRVPYHPGDTHAAAMPQKIASVRTSGISRDHVTT
ncbi:MAG: hypothetical protein JOZ59_03440, partial [Candidatus Eremiobacteraeota bacterium]|nr:hypothetical protein [Candidatus Eremiobacteraeota bacterium]